jgi:hypothetical protein
MLYRVGILKGSSISILLLRCYVDVLLLSEVKAVRAFLPARLVYDIINLISCLYQNSKVTSNSISFNFNLKFNIE